MTWLDDLVKRHIDRIPKAPKVFVPAAAFNFNDVRAVVAIGEQAISTVQSEEAAAAQARVRDAVQSAASPDFSFVEQGVFSNMALAFWKTEMTFPQVLRRAMLVATYSHVEHVLRRWCDGLEREWNLTEGMPPFRRRLSGASTQECCIRYLRDVAALAFNGYQNWPEWTRLDDYRCARNCLAHDGGTVTRDTDRTQIERLPEVQVDTSRLVDQDPVIILHAGACEAAVDAAESFFERMWGVYVADPRVAAVLGPNGR